MKTIDKKIIATATVGLALSVYAYAVEVKASSSPEYTAMCDTEYFSCTKVFRSKYGHLASHLGLVPVGSILDIPNALLGVFLYILFLMYPVGAKLKYGKQIYCGLSTVAIITCFYLAYVLAFVLQDICIVCMSTYLVNAILLYLTGSNVSARAKLKTT